MLLICIADEPVFGCNLNNLCTREKQTVPKFVQQIVKAIEHKDMTADGIYRACGNLSQVQKLRFQVNHGKYLVNRLIVREITLNL